MSKIIAHLSTHAYPREVLSMSEQAYLDLNFAPIGLPSVLAGEGPRG